MKNLNCLFLALATGLCVAASSPARNTGPLSRQALERYLRPGVATTRLPATRSLTPRHSISALPAHVRVTPHNIPGVDQTLYVCGSLLDQDNPGIYSYALRENTLTSMAVSPDLFANGNAFVRDGKYHCFVLEDLGFYVAAYVYIYDINTWQQVTYKYSSVKNTPTDIATDPSTNEVYGCFYGEGNLSTEKFVWARYDMENWTPLGIRELDQKLIAVAADAQGQYYAVGADSKFYKVDKNTGETTLVGETGLALTTEPQSMTVDTRFGDIYLSGELTDHSTGLYIIDPETGRATLVNQYPDNQLFLGIYVPVPEADYAAPAAPEDLSADFASGAISGRISFTIPTVTYGGSPLSSPLSWTVTVDDTEAATGTAQPGGQVSTEVLTTAGTHVFTVSASNAAGNGAVASTTIYVGPDAPVAVGDLKAEKTEDGIRISWTAPERGQHSAYFDPTKLTYDVIRKQDGKIVAQGTPQTSVTDRVSDGALTVWSYSVIPCHGDVRGEESVSNGVLVGEVVEIPWEDDFRSADTWPMYTVINVHEDKYTWKYDDYRHSATVDYDYNNPKDDWLITPKIHLEAGHSYKLEFMTRTKRVLPEKIEVKMGRGNTVADMTTVILEPTEITTEEYVPDIDRVFEFYISVPEDGDYNIGFHAMSEPQMARVEIHYIRLTAAGAATAPAAPENLAVIPAAGGELSAKVSFTAPATDINGNSIETLEKAEVYVNGTLAQTVDNPVPGSTVTVTVPTLQGDNTIMAKAYNEHGQGLESKVNVFTGVHIPASVTGLKASLGENGVTISWEAPTAGEDGGYIDPDALTYMIYRNDYTFLAYEHPGTEITDDLSNFPMTNGQAIVSYYVFPGNVAGKGVGVASNGIVLGQGVFELPFKESFTDGFPQNSPWGISSTTETGWWTTTKGATVTSVDNDNGMMWFLPKGPSESSLLYSGRFNLSKTVSPALSVWYYNDPGNPNTVEISWTENYSDYHILGVISHDAEGSEAGWRQFTANLDELKELPFVAFGIRGISASEGWGRSVYLDLLEVADRLDHNLEMMEFNAPGAISFGHEGFFGGYVTNRGEKRATGYSVDLLCNGKPVASAKGSPLAPGASGTFTFTYTPTIDLAPSAVFQAAVNWEQDMNHLNDASAERTVLIVTNDFPVVTDLAGDRDEQENVSLTWSAPAPGTATHRTVEDFEEYNSFIISNIGDWTLVDVDGEDGTLGLIFSGQPVEYMNSCNPHAWQVWNPGKCGMTTDDIGMDVLMSHSGEQCLVSFQDADGQNDDWLISPELSGNAQLLSFWVRTPIPNYGMETYEVLYSTSGNQPSDFIKVEGLKEEAFLNWEEVAAYLPEGTKYFAIRHTSIGKWLLAVDDIAFIAKDAGTEPLEIDSYAIYRDNAKIATVPATEHSFTDTEAGEPAHEYAVTVIYRQGESVYSNVVNTRGSGIGAVDATRPIASGLSGAISLRGASGMPVRIVSADGRSAYSGTAVSDHETYPATAGVYIVCAGSVRMKVVVR